MLIIENDLQEGDYFVNGFAHFLKGGIMVMYGIFTQLRWLGSFGECGWVGDLLFTLIK